jgi:predicted nucleic acid-binding protein
MAWVVDASVGIAWAHPGQATPESTALLHGSNEGVQLIVPLFWFTEMANGLLVLLRRKKLEPNDFEAALDHLETLSVTIDDGAGRAAFRASSALAQKHGLTLYDATYLELALRKQASLATRDEALKAAAKKCGLTVL